MTSYFKKAYSSLMGFGDPSLLPPQEFISEEDCSTCLHPCEEHKQYPSYLNIDQDYPLLGTVKPYGRHIIIATGTSDWSRKIEWVQGSFAYSLTSVWGNKRSWKNLITNSSMTSLYSTEPNSCDVMIFPDNIIVSNVTNEKAKEFWNLFVDKPLPTEPVDIETLETGSMKVSKVPYKSVLLLCSHKKRDKRCGLTAPILAQEFDHLFRQKDLSEEDAMILMVSHFGGHQFAGNVVCYTDEGKRGVWYGRVKTCHCEAIVEETIVKGKIVKDIYRGAMDYSFPEKKPNLQW